MQVDSRQRLDHLFGARNQRDEMQVALDSGRLISLVPLLRDQRDERQGGIRQRSAHLLWCRQAAAGRPVHRAPDKLCRVRDNTAATQLAHSCPPPTAPDSCHPPTAPDSCHPPTAPDSCHLQSSTLHGPCVTIVKKKSPVLLLAHLQLLWRCRSKPTPDHSERFCKARGKKRPFIPTHAAPVGESGPFL